MKQVEKKDISEQIKTLELDYYLSILNQYKEDIISITSLEDCILLHEKIKFLSKELKELDNKKILLDKKLMNSIKQIRDELNIKIKNIIIEDTNKNYSCDELLEMKREKWNSMKICNYSLYRIIKLLKILPKNENLTFPIKKNVLYLFLNEVFGMCKLKSAKNFNKECLTDIYKQEKVKIMEEAIIIDKSTDTTEELIEQDYDQSIMSKNVDFMKKIVINNFDNNYLIKLCELIGINYEDKNQTKENIKNFIVTNNVIVSALEAPFIKRDSMKIGEIYFKDIICLINEYFKNCPSSNPYINYSFCDILGLDLFMKKKAYFPPEEIEKSKTDPNYKPKRKFQQWEYTPYEVERFRNILFKQIRKKYRTKSDFKKVYLITVFEGNSISTICKSLRIQNITELENLIYKDEPESITKKIDHEKLKGSINVKTVKVKAKKIERLDEADFAPIS